MSREFFCLATGNTGITSVSATISLYFVVFTEMEFLRLGKNILGTPQFSIPALGPIQPPVQWVPGLSRG
jgi:hypothetical protein